MNIVETINVSREVAWLPWAVQYFFLIGLSYGALLLSLPGLVLRRPGQLGVARLALLGALVCGLAAPVALLADLHQPGRFWHFYAYFTATSWMSWGAFFIPVYLTGLMLYAWLAFRPVLWAHAREGGRFAGAARWLALGGHESRPALLAAAALALLGALLVCLYTGAEVMAVRARPLWHTPLLPLQFGATAMVGAGGMVMLLARCSPLRWQPAAMAGLSRSVARWQLAALAIGALWLALALSGLSGVPARALAEVGASPSWRLTAAWAVLATALTAWLAWRRPGWHLTLAVLALHSAWMLRWTVFIGGQEVPKTGAGFYRYELPLGPEGLLGIAGTAGLWLCLFIVITNVLPLARLAPAAGQPGPHAPY